MNLRSELAGLRRQRGQELRTLHLTYVRTKRELKRDVSPARMIRRHVGASLTVAAVAGFLLAPRAAPRVRSTRRRRRAKSRLVDHVRQLLVEYFPQLADLIPGFQSPVQEPTPAPAGTAAEPRQQPRPRTTPMQVLLKLAFLLLGNAQLRAIILESIRNRSAYAQRHAGGNGQEGPATDASASDAPAADSVQDPRDHEKQE